MKNTIHRLDNLIDIISGYPFDASLFNEEAIGLPLIRVRDVNSGFAGIYYSGRYEKSSLINNGDILIGLDGDFKCIEWKNGVALLNQRVCRIIPKKGRIAKEYLLHFLPSVLAQINRTTNFTTVKHLSTKTIKDIEVDLPPFSDQIHIANILSKAKSLITQRKESIALLDELLKSLFYQMFIDKGYPLKRIEELSTKVTDGEHLKPIYREAGVPFISVVNITNGYLNFDNCKFVSVDDYEKFTRRCNPEKGDIIYTKVGATYGRAVVVDTDKPFCLYVSVALIKPKKMVVNSKYLQYAINHPFVKRQADKSIKGAGVPDLHLIEIKSFKIPIPPYETQTRFGKLVEKFDLLKAEYKKSLHELENLYGALNLMAFKGELTKESPKITNLVKD